MIFVALAVAGCVGSIGDKNLPLNGRTEMDFFGDRDLEEGPEYRGPLEMLMV